MRTQLAAGADDELASYQPVGRISCGARVKVDTFPQLIRKLLFVSLPRKLGDNEIISRTFLFFSFWAEWGMSGIIRFINLKSSNDERKMKTFARTKTIFSSQIDENIFEGAKLFFK